MRRMLLGTAGRGTVTSEPREDKPLAGKTTTRLNLVEAVYREVGLSWDESVRLVEAVIEEIAGELAEGLPVGISSFGSFTVRKKAPRMGRNPRTGEPAPIPAKRVVMFKPSNVLKEQVTRSLSDRP